MIRPRKGYWKTDEQGVLRLSKANRLALLGYTLSYVRYIKDFPVLPLNNVWEDTVTSGFGDPKVYVVQTLSRIVERCLLMTTDPGDLVLDPTCGSGTTAYVAEQWGRRWITIDTSRVALALARARIMGARYPYYLLADSREGQLKEAEVTRTAPVYAAGARQHPPRLRLRARAAHHAQIDRQQRRDRRHLGEVAGDAGAAARIAERRAQEDLAGMGDSPRGRRQVARRGEEAPRRMVAGAHRAAEGDRRLDRRQGRVRIPLRQALRGQEEGPRGRAVHRREPVAAPDAGRR